MKPLLPLVFLLFCGCATEEIEMKETPLKLTGMQKHQAGDEQDLQLTWRSLDGNINIVTTAPVVDSNDYVVGSVYARCFLKR